jgi:DDE domain
MPPVRADTRSAIAGWSMRPTPRSLAAGLNLYRAVDQHGQVIDVLVSKRRDCAAVRAFHPREATRAGPDGGHHRPGAGLPAGCRRAAVRRSARP